MVDFSRGVMVQIAALTLALLAPTLSHAADLLPPSPSFDSVEEERVTFGTGWYLRGDAAISNDTKLAIGNVALPSSKDFFNSWSVGIGAGYKYNEWFRTDVTVDWRNPRSFTGNTASATCITGFYATSTTTEAAFTSNCSDYTRARINDFHVLFNGYVDLGTWYGVTPYIGAGVGFNYTYQRVARNWFMANGNSYDVTFADAINPALTWQYNWDQSRSTSNLQFAWSLMTGVSYAITPHLTADLGYRYVNLGSITNYGSFYGPSKVKLQAQDLRLGFRYTPD